MRIIEIFWREGDFIMKGYFGKYGGAFVSDEVKKALNE